MLRSIFISLIICFNIQINAQYAPAVGQVGSTAISKDSSIIHNWAIACNVKRGWINIADTSLGKASNGITDNAFGVADNSTISLGDGGIATLNFIYPIIDGPSWDFVVFENAFDDFYLELAFVEVSSDGENFFRFPAHSLTQTDSQVSGFGQLNTSKINNLAGKYKGGYGTPFDLSELPSYSALNIQHITHIRIIDVVGSIDTTYGTTDTAGNMINDPFPTPFASSGFDLDAVGVIHQTIGINTFNPSKKSIRLYPNPTNNYLNIETKEIGTIEIYSQLGEFVLQEKINYPKTRINVSNLLSGVYIVIIKSEKNIYTSQLIKY
jgi:hypothetical protein